MAASKDLQHKRVERVAHSSAVSSVAYTRPGDGKIATTKSGAYIYDGDPSKFFDWEFRTRLKVKKAGSDFEKYAGVMSEVVEGLQGDAFIVAKEMGTEVFCHPGTKPATTADEDDDAEPLMLPIRARTAPAATSPTLRNSPSLLEIAKDQSDRSARHLLRHERKTGASDIFTLQLLMDWPPLIVD